jgi:hypothetical protein
MHHGWCQTGVACATGALLRLPYTPPPTTTTTTTTTTTSCCQALAAAVTLPGLRPGLYLYTTPPKVLLKDKDLGATLYEAQLVPAAHIHVGFNPDKCGGAGQGAGPVLQPEVEALLQQEVPPEVLPSAAAEDSTAPSAAGSSGASQAAGSSAVRAAAAAVTGGGAASLSAAAGGAGSAPGAKVPKWLKIGKS